MKAFLDAEYTPSVIEQSLSESHVSCLWQYRFYQKQGMLCIKNVLFETASQQSILNIMGMSL
ncbi:acetyltransferase%2C GNAT family [Enterobacter bugandensis]|nr:acetyltransferase%2C GNAT family [Enterobacter bugandensis]